MYRRATGTSCSGFALLRNLAAKCEGLYDRDWELFDCGISLHGSQAEVLCLIDESERQFDRQEGRVQCEKT